MERVEIQQTQLQMELQQADVLLPIDQIVM
jgi:multidrug efflux pump subunit AcrA (membrane-fusion protein)